MAHDVFISHSHSDKALADAACARLEERGIRCWITPRDIPPGGDWAAAITEAIASARVFVLFFIWLVSLGACPMSPVFTMRHRRRSCDD
jgi:hypothetical protein